MQISEIKEVLNEISSSFKIDEKMGVVTAIFDTQCPDRVLDYMEESIVVDGIKTKISDTNLKVESVTDRKPGSIEVRFSYK